jgi:hypothetical protein
MVAAHAKILKAQRILEQAEEEEQAFKSRFEEMEPEVFRPASFSLFCGVITVLIYGALMISTAYNLNLFLFGLGIVVGLTGLVLGIFALITLHLNSKVFTGKAFAIPGIAVSVLFGFILPWFPAANSWQELDNLKHDAHWRSNLEELTLAHFKFAEKMGYLPDDIRDSEGKALLSWRVALLPFLGENELYGKFKLDEPWDSEDNFRLVRQMPPALFSQSSNSKRGEVSFQHLTGALTVYSGEGLPPTLETIDNGDRRRSTLLLVEVDASEVCPWSKPDDWEFDPEMPRRGLRRKGTAAFADGTVIRLPVDLSDSQMTAFVTVAGGEQFERPKE